MPPSVIVYVTGPASNPGTGRVPEAGFTTPDDTSHVGASVERSVP